MCRTIHSVLGTLICMVQMFVRVLMTVILMLENLLRMFLQTFYNFISFMLQLISLIPICMVFLLTSRLKCLMCGGGGPCPVNRGGTCDCLMSAVAIIILYFIFRATGLMDKIFYKLGYAKATPEPFTRYVPTPGDVTECSRETDGTDKDDSDTDLTNIEDTTKNRRSNFKSDIMEGFEDTESSDDGSDITPTAPPRRMFYDQLTTVVFYAQ